MRYAISLVALLFLSSDCLANTAFYYQKSDSRVISTNNNPGDPQKEADSQGSNISYLILPNDVPPVRLKLRKVVNGAVVYADDQEAIDQKTAMDLSMNQKRNDLKAKLNLTDSDLDELKQVMAR